ncbi:hypothetical protein KIS1582_4226 [Cytobacillus firmus]|uniref:Uncharacterized protein n=1 Tax=Cytobacillus firmus TaxID=1399 RepID=A0A800MTB2_CYTFI|nr:hypothetical protein KIS1582_4226 [Cytobacillus firmus]
MSILFLLFFEILENTRDNCCLWGFNYIPPADKKKPKSLKIQASI